ncbi:MAG TPA: class I SAM-dependent methyltransferase [Steroidobacteraceae bacterium]
MSKSNPSKEEFEMVYSVSDPWGVNNSVPNIVRKQRLLQELRHCRFQYGLDIGCGEGDLTNALKVVNKFDALDISEIAVRRAKESYPHINFFVADLKEISQFSKDRYDFICSFETLYYLSDESERDKALMEIKELGTANCVYCFSLVTVGETEFRRYFRLDEAIALLQKHFNIINQFPISLQKLPLVARVLSRLCPALMVWPYQVRLRSTRPEKAYQNCFIAVRKS